MNLKFREDINGLRGIAVIAVVLFHFNSNWVPGGFAGVDVFFVISGYLMTGIIFSGFESNSFSLLKFYVARANRIIPALTAVCLLLLIFGWFFLTPIDYKLLGKHAGSSLSFLSNLTYWREAGYFDSASQEKWLLHTWSLSVEWQFYIIYPIILIALLKLAPISTLKHIVLAVAIIGFFVSVFCTYKWPNAAYYILPTRAWEMMIGGVAYLYPLKNRPKTDKALEYLGISLLASTYLLISKENYWPGYLSLAPVAGTFLIIQAQRNKSAFTTNLVLQKLGKWSYSIYLWHWPIVVAIYYFFSTHSVALSLTGVVLSIFLGFLSFKYIERIRLPNSPSLTKAIQHPLIYTTIGLASLTGFIFIKQGIPERFTTTSELASISKELKMPLRKNGYCFYTLNNSAPTLEGAATNCYLGATTVKPSTILFGDSFAGHYEPFLDEVFKVNHQSFQSVTTNWCTPSLSNKFTGPITHPSYKQCLENRAYLKENLHNYDNLIIAGQWEAALNTDQLDEVKELARKANEHQLNVFILAAPYQFSGNPLNHLYRSIYFDLGFDINQVPSNDLNMANANAMMKKFSIENENFHYIDRQLLYNKTGTFELNGLTIPYSLDGGHISILGSKQCAKHFVSSPHYKEIMSKFSFPTHTK